MSKHSNIQKKGIKFTLFMLFLPVITIASNSVFEDITQKSGVNFNHFNGMTGKFYFPEMTGSGGALFDFDNDGDLDLYIVQGALLGKNDTLKDTFYKPQQPIGDKLYRNDYILNGKVQGNVSFTDVTEQSKLAVTDYGMGVAVGDYNNDGWRDLVVTNYGFNRLLKNNGDGTFSDQSDALKQSQHRWGTSASFFDYNNDGWLDLYITNYVDYDVNNLKKCYARNSRLDYCGPAAFTPQADTLYLNNGDGSFSDVTFKTLSDYQAGPGLGVIADDFNNDGWLDLFVANDGAANQLWLNQQGKGFVDDALFSGTAFNLDGQAEASMGVDAADFDNDGDSDLFMTHLMGETNTLYKNDGTGLFTDVSQKMGLGLSSLPYTAFGTAWLDFDNDTFLDLVVLNGAVTSIESQLQAGEIYPLKQPNQLFKNISGGSFKELKGESVSSLNQSYVSRGAAVGDLDNDGDTDLVVFNNNGPVRILQNTYTEKPNWVGFSLNSKQFKRTSYGAKIEIKLASGKSMWRRVRADGSYCSANDDRILVGLGSNTKINQVVIHQPSKKPHILNSFKLKQYNSITL